jgi:DNA ligase (NAD+)
LEKAGEIIPKITGLATKGNPDEVIPILFPDKCPACGSPLERPEGEVAYYCPNKASCPPQIQGEIEHFIQRKAMDIASIGPETIALLLEKGLIHNVADLYTLKKEDLINLDRFKEKSAQNLISGIEGSKTVPFDRVLFALGIRFVGSTTAQKLVQAFSTIESLQSASYDQLVAVPEIGGKIAESIIHYFQNEANCALIARLKSGGLQFQAEKTMEVGDKFQGLTFVVSGVFSNFSRDELKQTIQQNGGKVVSSISKSLNYLIAGDKMGPSKKEKAEKFQVNIITEEEFIEMLD